MWVHFFLNFKISFQVLRTTLFQSSNVWEPKRYYKCVHFVISALANILTQRNFRCITQKMASSFSWHQRHLLKFVYYPQCNAPMHFLIKSSIANAVQSIIKYVFLTFILRNKHSIYNWFYQFFCAFVKCLMQTNTFLF